MERQIYIASCVFTSRFPKLSVRIQDYVKERFGFEIVRCCVPSYKIAFFEEKMPEGELRECWKRLPDSAPFEAGDTVYSLCHNCSNIIEEMHPGVNVCSLWELIDQDEQFPIPQYSGMRAAIQDCWRAKDRTAEQDAVRSLLSKMNIVYTELPENRNRTEFCGSSLYRKQPERNPKLAPKHYAEGAEGKFIPHSEEEITAIMKDWCASMPEDNVICYCHYCLEGLLAGGADAVHIAQLLFPDLETGR